MGSDKEKRVQFPRVRSSLAVLQSRNYLFLAILILASLWPAAAQSPQESLGAIIGALQVHDYPRALGLSEAALSAQPKDYRIWTLRGMATAGTGDLPGALAAYEQALQLAPDYLAALEGAAQTEFQMGRSGAKALLLQILEQRPDDPTAHTLLGVLEFRGGRCAAALEHFAKATPVLAHQPEALTADGTCLAETHRDEEAATAFAQALALDPNRQVARYNLALAQWDARHPADAWTTLGPLVKETPVDNDVLNLAVDILDAQGDTAQALALLRSAVLANPKDGDAYLRFATLSFDHASPQVGVDILNVGLTQLPNEARLYLVRGILLAQMGEFARAADDFDRANRIDPHLQFVGVAEGLVQSQQHNPEEALARFRASVRAHPNDSYALYLLAEALSEQGKPEGTPEYKEEVEAATRAVKLDPGLVAARDLLSTVYYASGHLDQAIEQSRAALEHDPNDEQALYHLILALRKTGQNSQVQVLVKRLVELRASTKTNQPPGNRFRLHEESGDAPTP